MLLRGGNRAKRPRIGNRGVRSGHCYLLAAMPFCHLSFTCRKPKIISHLWKSEHYPANPRYIREHIKKRRFDR